MLKQLALLPGDVRCSAAAKLAANMSRKLMLPSLASTAGQQLQQQHATKALDTAGVLDNELGHAVVPSGGLLRVQGSLANSNCQLS
jgi:hypothetical protein